MSKMLLSVFIGIAVLATTVSASDFFSSLKYGIRAGGNMSQTSGKATGKATATMKKKKFKIGGVIGGSVTHKQSETLSFTSGLQYSMKGYQEENSELVPVQGFGTIDLDTKYKYKFNYLEIPVYTTYTFPQEVYGFKFYVLGGGYVSYILSAKVKVDASTDFSNDTIETDIKDAINDSDYGLLSGLGLIYNDRVSVDFRFEWGLKEVNSIVGENRNISLGVSYLFN